MEIAMAVLERLERIHELERDGAATDVLLDELRALVVEAETYAWEEGGEECGAAVERLRQALARDMIEV
jgi:hypothetical protein